MKEQLIGIDVAKLFKKVSLKYRLLDKNFKGGSRLYYHKDPSNYPVIKEFTCDYELFHKEGHTGWIIISQSLVQKWLREVHNKHINTFPLKNGKWEWICFHLDRPLRTEGNGFENTMSLIYDDENTYFDSHEEALEHALEKILKVL